MDRRGLLDPTATNADERRELLALLESRGVPLDEMVRAREDGQLVVAAGDRELRPGARFTIDELIRRTGADDAEFAVQLRVATGFRRPSWTSRPSPTTTSRCSGCSAWRAGSSAGTNCSTSPA
ncbi:MAG: hypothetical protein R2713_02720 [Ilumatobacteraceae bacterium]